MGAVAAHDRGRFLAESIKLKTMAIFLDARRERADIDTATAYRLAASAQDLAARLR